MDWEPTIATKVNAYTPRNGNLDGHPKGPGLPNDYLLRGKRARWVSEEELNRRKADKVCWRCARKGCTSKVCPLAATVRPKVKASNTAAQRGWRRFEHKMNGETFRIDTVIDRQKLIPALIDNGSEAYASVNDNLVRRLGLPRIQIPKRPLEGVAATHNGSISEVTYFSIDIEGHTQERIYAYIIPDQREKLILGMP